jgi:enoyl-CoA hydratase/carnithine racemase
MSKTFEFAAKDDSCKALILIGRGPYYCAGVNLAAIIKPM